VDPRDADLVVSTVHKVKGLEWPRVQIDARLVPEQSDGQTADGSKDELRVAYVAVTRAQEVLDATAVEGYHGRRRARSEAVAAPSA
jgi:superfamily I DNA/RNA helicase